MHFFLTLVLAVFVCVSNQAEAQSSKKLPVIGTLGASSRASNDRTDAFRQGLSQLGYIEGKNIIVERRNAEGKQDRLSELAAELVRLKIDVIVAGGSNATRAAKNATSIIPIVMAQSADPVAEGFVASLARPGGNITGLSNLSPELNGKRLELLKETIPRLSQLAVFHTSTSGGNAATVKKVARLAAALGIKAQPLDVLGEKDFEPAFRAAAKGHADAGLVLVWGAILNPYRVEFADLAIRYRLPAMYQQREHVEAGGLMTYGVSEVDLNRRAAIYVDKILKGAKPADLPVEQPTKFELVVNLKAAKQIGLTIPQRVLIKADRVIK